MLKHTVDYQHHDGNDAPSICVLGSDLQQTQEWQCSSATVVKQILHRQERPL